MLITLTTFMSTFYLSFRFQQNEMQDNKSNGGKRMKNSRILLNQEYNIPVMKKT